MRSPRSRPHRARERFRAALTGVSPGGRVAAACRRSVALAYAFTGESASTRVLISQVEARLDEAARQAFVARSDALGHELESGLGGGDFRAFKEAVTTQHALLQELGPLETEAMRRMLAIAASYGCAGKLSGAGGGDGCILFAPNTEARGGAAEGTGGSRLPLDDAGGGAGLARRGPGGPAAARLAGRARLML